MDEPTGTIPTSGMTAGTGAESGDVATIARALDDWYTRLGRQFGPLSRPQRRMLHLLAREERMRVSDLAEALGLTTAGSTRMLDTLESQGYASRTRIPQTDQRQVYVSITPAGSEALLQSDMVYLGRVAGMLQALGAAQRAQLARLLHAIGSERDTPSGAE